VADQRHELALGNRQVDVAQRGEQALGRLEGLLDASNVLRTGFGESPCGFGSSMG